MHGTQVCAFTLKSPGTQFLASSHVGGLMSYRSCQGLVLTQNPCSAIHTLTHQSSLPEGWDFPSPARPTRSEDQSSQE